MARNSNPVTHPIFQEPVFNEAVVSGGPAGFQQPHPSDDYGYLRISANKDQLRIGFHQASNQSILQSRYDLVTVDLKSHQIVAN